MRSGGWRSSLAAERKAGEMVEKDAGTTTKLSPTGLGSARTLRACGPNHARIRNSFARAGEILKERFQRTRKSLREPRRRLMLPLRVPTCLRTGARRFRPEGTSLSGQSHLQGAVPRVQIQVRSGRLGRYFRNYRPSCCFPNYPSVSWAKKHGRHAPGWLSSHDGRHEVRPFFGRCR